MSDLYREIAEERVRQEQLKLQGRFTHTLADAHPNPISVLGEEFGEICRAWMERADNVSDKHDKNVRKELIQLAACCVAMIQGLDAGTYGWNDKG